MGSRVPGWSSRVVRLGSSAITVRLPTRIASTSLRSSCTLRRESSPVTHFEWPVRVAIFESRCPMAVSVPCAGSVEIVLESQP